MSGRIFIPFPIGPFTIIPEGASPPAAGIPIVLGRKGAFGSGEHETTVSCLQFLSRLPPLSGARVLDLGSGTGILAIAALRLGAAAAVGVDTSWDASLSCALNGRLNGVARALLPVCGELSAVGTRDFDLLLANIYADLHLALAEEMIARVRPGGTLLLSGIPLQDKFDVQQRFVRQGCTLLDMEILEEYTTFLLRKG